MIFFNLFHHHETLHVFFFPPSITRQRKNLFFYLEIIPVFLYNLSGTEKDGRTVHDERKSISAEP